MNVVVVAVDAVFSNGLTRLNDLSKEAIIQAIKDQDLRFLQVEDSSRTRNFAFYR